MIVREDHVVAVGESCAQYKFLYIEFTAVDISVAYFADFEKFSFL